MFFSKKVGLVECIQLNDFPFQREVEFDEYVPTANPEVERLF